MYVFKKEVKKLNQQIILYNYNYTIINNTI